MNAQKSIQLWLSNMRHIQILITGVTAGVITFLSGRIFLEWFFHNSSLIEVVLTVGFLVHLLWVTLLANLYFIKVAKISENSLIYFIQLIHGAITGAITLAVMIALTLRILSGVT
jgi:hypothetical protein